MAQAAANSGWLRGKVNDVLSGDTLVIMGFTKAEIRAENTVVLAHLSAPRLARRGVQDDPFAWESREYLRKLCIGKDVVFRRNIPFQISPENSAVFSSALQMLETRLSLTVGLRLRRLKER